MRTDQTSPLESWLTTYKRSAPTRRAARHQAARRPRAIQPPPPRPEPKRFVGSHFQRLQAMGAAPPTLRVLPADERAGCPPRCAPLTSKK